MWSEEVQEILDRLPTKVAEELEIMWGLLDESKDSTIYGLNRERLYGFLHALELTGTITRAEKRLLK